MFQQEVAERICAAPGGRRLRQAVGAGAMDLRRGAGAAHSARGLRSSAESVVGGGAADAARDAAGCGVVRGDGAADRRGVRPAAQDAARRAEAAGRRGAVARGRDRTRAAGGDADGRRIRKLARARRKTGNPPPLEGGARGEVSPDPTPPPALPQGEGVPSPPLYRHYHLSAAAECVCGSRSPQPNSFCRYAPAAYSRL